MNQRYLKDNCFPVKPPDWSDEDFRSIGVFANKTIGELCDENPNLIVYPDKSKDQIEKNPILKQYSDNTIETNNLVGFIGKGEFRLNIGSRFSSNVEQDFYLQYMLQKTCHMNFIDLKKEFGSANIWDFLLFFIFPMYLKKALRQGLFKIYRKHSYNDSNVKGQIDIDRHIKYNIPFIGNVAYSTREFSFNNHVTQLIRHTIEYIQSRGFHKLFTKDTEILQAFQTIKTITPDYNIRHRQKIVQNNCSTIKHPFFTEYEPLRKICIQILRSDSLSLNNEKDKIYGVIIDSAWLWEEYLSTILSELQFVHPDNINRREGIYFFDDKSTKVYPDFYDKSKQIVIDAKYKRLKDNEFSREDTFQVVSYMYRLRATSGILLYPTCTNNQKTNKNMNFDSYGGGSAYLMKYGFYIPEAQENFTDFSEEISKSEQKISELLMKISMDEKKTKALQ